MSARPPQLQEKIPSFRVTQLLEAAPERFDTRVARRIRTGSQEADTPDSRRLLRLDSDRRKNEADSKNDREPDQTHGHLGEMAGASLADLNYWRRAGSGLMLITVTQSLPGHSVAIGLAQ